MSGNNKKDILWNLTPLFQSDDDPLIEQKRKDLEEQSYRFINKWKDRKDYLEDPKVLKEALDDYEFWAKNYGESGDEGYYYWLRTQQDQNDPELKAKYNKIKDLGLKIGNDIQFFTHRIAKIPQKKQKKFLDSPDLASYRHFLESLFKEAHYLLSEEEEKILNLVGSTSYSNWVKMVSGFLSKEQREVFNAEGKRETQDFSTIVSLLNSPKKIVRDSANIAFNDVLSSHAESSEAEINSVLEFKKVNDMLRGVERPDITRHIADDIETEVVDVLLESVQKRFDISAKYYRLKANLMGVEKLEYHERNVDYGEVELNYPWKESVDLVKRTFSNLDPEFLEIFNNFEKNGYFDVYPRKNKSGGAFCASLLPTQPTYILLNHTNRMNDVLTLAHEMGHGINSYLVCKTQNALNDGTPTSTAEVASTFMEDFVLEEVLKEADDPTRLSLMMAKLNSDISSIQRQAACYKFEQELHDSYREKGYLSKEFIGKIFQKHMLAYMGDYVEQSEGSENWWVYWSHIRRFFYVYSYASGLLISKSLQNLVKEDNSFILKVKEFLSAGSSDSPKNVFADLGVDIAGKEFWDRGLNEIEVLLGETEDLAVKLKKISEKLND
jgi:oligoendopeptidase F